MLAAIAGRTERIRLGTAVTVLSTQDPVRVYTEFATLDAVSNGRAQLIVGRGSLTESFPLFGFDLADYETLFERSSTCSRACSGPTRDVVRHRAVTAHRPVREPSSPSRSPPKGVGVGGSPAVGGASRPDGLPTDVGRHRRLSQPIRANVELYKRTLDEYGHPPQPSACTRPVMWPRTDEVAADIQWPYWAEAARRRHRASAAGHRPTISSSKTRSRADRCTSDPPKPSRPSPRPLIRLLGVSRFDMAYATRTSAPRTENGDDRALRA